ncbi:protein-L-histidine N-pros-methyltransferase-like [Ornithodoros turicata]|uniref:Methyltransferase-like protein 9 n=1 Tax=Ornithodoros turicata TaxID=34597 RepID=A0A2R5LI63_9ACAR
MSHPRPLLYSPLARSLYERMLRDQELQTLDRSAWYEVDVSKVSDEVLRSKFVQCGLDDETKDFIERSEQKSGWLVTQIIHSFARLFFGWFFTKTSLNGLLGRGSMFVFSRAQFGQLLTVGESDMAAFTEAKSPSPLFSSLLDIGAGDGNVTAVIAPFFAKVDVTEMSPVMRRLLARRGFCVLDVDTWKTDESRCPEPYDVISCLNVLDRCEKPLTLLEDIRSRMEPGRSRLVLAVVFPVSQYVELGRQHNKPAEVLHVRGGTFEEQVQSFYYDVLVPSGFVLEAWTRLPYLCEGDLEQAFYWLDDVVMVLRRAS